jgi:hypothetical protein
MNARASSLRTAIDAVAALEEVVPTNIIPVAGEQWQRSVTDADLPRILVDYDDCRWEVTSNSGAEGVISSRMESSTRRTLRLWTLQTGRSRCSASRSRRGDLHNRFHTDDG